MSKEFKITLAAIFFIFFTSLFTFFLLVIHKDYKNMIVSQDNLSKSLDNHSKTMENIVAKGSAVKTASKSAK